MKASSFTIGSNISCTGSGGGGSGTSTPTRPSHSLPNSKIDDPKGKENSRQKAYEFISASEEKQIQDSSNGLE